MRRTNSFVESSATSSISVRRIGRHTAVCRSSAVSVLSAKRSNVPHDSCHTSQKIAIQKRGPPVEIATQGLTARFFASSGGWSFADAEQLFDARANSQFMQVDERHIPLLV